MERMEPTRAGAAVVEQKMEGSGMNEKCGSCRFWRDLEDDGLGLCRRRSPTEAVKVHPDLCSSDLWPTTFTDWWCGEFEPRPTPA